MIKKILNRIANYNRIVTINKKQKCEISRRAYIDDLSIIHGRNKIGLKTSLVKSEIGFASYVSSSCSFIQTKIGNYCSIASNVKIVAGNHPTSKYVSTHPLFYAKRDFSGLIFHNTNIFEEFSYTNDSKLYMCEIGNDVWIGDDVSILNGVSIGDGAIIATGAVVCKNVPPYAIVGGIPAKIIRYRFDQADIEFLLTHKWWERSLAWIQENANYFSDIERFKEIGETNDSCD